MEIIPAIDIIEGKCVRLIKGDFNKKTIYSDDPTTTARAWESNGADRIHIVDLDGAKKGMPTNKGIIFEIVKAVKVPTQVGGGIRSLETIEEYISNGVSKVILGSIVFEDEKLLEKALSVYQEHIIVSLDVRNERVLIYGWLKETKFNYIDIGKKLRDLGVREFIYTNIERDGTLSSPDIEGLKRFITLVGVSTIASGGISTLEDIRRIKEAGATGAIIGKALYEGKINLEEAITYAH
ncbi:MAG: 1-(5-phosphoribosyl)-5-[(5-phosphoribosylamino)methylideneamino]imidazole-4-carboxamide isomerase [bacterium]|nr:1-(5-phosphoribosyl)-5-[(5-phosphoribosylamino)methylideneamino]imidazole-4-carboxamide isomerase [bacterium]